MASESRSQIGLICATKSAGVHSVSGSIEGPVGMSRNVRNGPGILSRPLTQLPHGKRCAYWKSVVIVDPLATRLRCYTVQSSPDRRYDKDLLVIKNILELKYFTQFERTLVTLRPQ